MFGVHGNGYVVQNWFMIRILLLSSYETLLDEHGLNKRVRMSFVRGLMQRRCITSKLHHFDRHIPLRYVLFVLRQVETNGWIFSFIIRVIVTWDG